jgi:hypothetical protein
MSNTAKFEEGSEVIVDTEVEAADAGWTLNYVSINRTGNLVALHIEAAFGIAAAAPVCTVQPDFAPGATVTSPDGEFTLTAAGVLSFAGSTSAAGSAICQLVFQAGEVSP